MPGPMDSMTIASAHSGGTTTFGVGNNKTNPIRVSDMTWKPRMAGGPISRLNVAGSFPSHVDPRELVVDIQGRIVAADPADYWNVRKAFVQSFMPPPDYDRTIFHHATLTITPPSESAAYLLVTTSDYDIPLTPLGYSTEYRISFSAPFGYWRAVSGDAVVFY